MINNQSEAQMLALFIIDELPDEVTSSELRSILIACGELNAMEIDQYVESLEKAGQIYSADRDGEISGSSKTENSKGENYIGITDLGAELVKTLEHRKSLCRSAINRAMREYKKLTCGIDYKINLEQAEGGSYVKFEMFAGGKLYFATSLFFAKSREALEVYNRMDDDPESFYNGFLTVATGSIDYLM